MILPHKNLSLDSSKIKLYVSFIKKKEKILKTHHKGIL